MLLSTLVAKDERSFLYVIYTYRYIFQELHRKFMSFEIQVIVMLSEFDTWSWVAEIVVDLPVTWGLGKELIWSFVNRSLHILHIKRGLELPLQGESWQTTGSTKTMREAKMINTYRRSSIGFSPSFQTPTNPESLCYHDRQVAMLDNRRIAFSGCRDLSLSRYQSSRCYYGWHCLQQFK